MSHDSDLDSFDADKPRPALDMNTIDGLERFIELMVPMMRANIERDGELMPFAVICGRRDPRDGSALKEPEPIIIALAVPMRDDDDKDTVRAFLDDALSKTNGVGIAFVTEAWAVNYDLDLDGVFHDFYTKRPSQHPNRIEIVSIVCEHMTGASASFFKIPILRDGDKVTLGEPEKNRMPQIPTGGRFNDFFGLGRSIQA